MMWKGAIVFPKLKIGDTEREKERERERKKERERDLHNLNFSSTCRFSSTC
jgi:hypothetical protein